MDLFVFSSKNVTNIWAGVGARLWAVSRRKDSFMQGLATRARERMGVGSSGVFYCSKGQFLTTPFLVYSLPNEERVVRDVWPEEWVLPFHIHPLGTPHKQLLLSTAKKTLPVLTKDPGKNPSHILHMQATTVSFPLKSALKIGRFCSAI